MSTSSGRTPSGPATLAASQAVIASRDAHGPDGAAMRGRRGRRGLSCCGIGPIRTRPLRDGLERPGQERLATGMALNLAARSSGEARQLDQPDREDLEVQRLGDLAADRGEDRLGRTIREPPLDLQHDRQPFLARHLDREGSGTARSERGMATLGRPLDVLRINVPPPEDDQILDPAGDEQLALAQEAEVSSAEK